MKWVLRFFGLVLTLLIIAGVIGFLYFETVVAREAEKIASRELGVPVSVGVITVGWIDKTITVRNIKIANPEGFKTPYFVKVPTIRVQASNRIFQKPLVVDSITIDGLTAYYEMSEKGNNLKAIQKNLLNSSTSTKKAEASKKNDPKKEFIIEDLKISNAVLTPALSIAGRGVDQSVPISLIHLQNIGSKSNPAQSREVILRVMTSLVGSIQTTALPKMVLEGVTDGAVEGINKAKDAIGGAIDGLFGK